MTAGGMYDEMWNSATIFASLVWGTIGVAYFVYGKKQASWPAMAGGVLMVATAYFAASVWVMSAISVATIVTVYLLLKRGY